MATAMSYSKDGKAIGGPVRKKLKTSDLPLASATRAAIEGLAHTFKKKGGYDSLRKQVWDDLEGSDFEAEFTRSLLKVADDELEKNPSGLLKLDRGKATLLIEGAVDRAGVYQTAEARIDHLIDAHIEEIETGIRALRREDIGAEAAAAEHAKGGKTDEQYAEEAAKKRAVREKIREDLREKERAILEEKRKMERARRKEEERKIEAEQERRKEEREARKKAEREREEERDRQRDRDRDLRDRDRERDSHRDRRDRSRDRDRDRERERDRGRDDRHSRYEDDSRRHSTRDVKEAVSKADLSKEEVERIEQEALNDLLKEGKRVAQRSRHQLDIEIDDSLAPPPRKLKPASAILPISRDSPSVSAEVRKASSSSSKPKVEDGEFKMPLSTAKISEADKTDSRDKRSSYRSRSRDRASTRRSSRSRSRRRRDSKDRRSSVSKIDDTEAKGVDSRKDKEERHRSRRDSKDRDDRHRRDSRDRDDHHRRDSRDRDDKRRRSSRDRDDRRHRTRSRSPDRRRSYRSRSRDRKDREEARDISPTTHRPLTSTELWKLAETKKREEEARAYLAAQNDARAKGLPIPGGWNDRAGQVASTPRHRLDDRVTSPVSVRKRDSSRDRDRDRDRDRERSSRLRSRSRSPTRRKSRIERSTSPVNIDRYVPGGGSHRHKSAIAQSPSRKRERSRDADRDRDRESRRSRDDEKPRRRSRSRSRRRDRSRDRERKARSRSRSPRRERDSKRDRSRSRDKDRERRRERSRSRDRDRDRKRSRSRGSRRESRRE